MFSNRLQMVLKCSRNKKVTNELLEECATAVLTVFSQLLLFIGQQTHGNMESPRFI